VLVIVLTLLSITGLIRAFRNSGRPATEPTPTPAVTGIFSGMGGWIAYGNLFGDTYGGHPSGIWAMDPERRGIRVRLSTHLGQPLAWSSDGSKLLIQRVSKQSSPFGAALYVLNADGSETLLIDPGPVIDPGPGNGLTGGSFSPDGSTLASGSMDSNLRLWDVGTALTGEAQRVLVRQPAGVTALIYAGGGDWILTGHSSRILRLLDARTGRLVASMRGPEAQVSLLCLSPDGQRVAVAGHDRVIRLFDMATREQTAAFPPLRRPCTSLSFLSDASHLASVSQENSVQLWDLEAGAPRAALWGQAGESFVGIALLANGDHLVVALADGRIRVWGPGA
jgi:WD40 repeat protein